MNKKEFLEQFEAEFKNAAFPSEVKYYPDGTLVANTPGLSKKEYFAALAVQGILANSIGSMDSVESSISLADETSIAEWAVKQADALIEELKK